MNSMMIDIETLSTAHDAAVIAVGWAVFDETGVLAVEGGAIKPDDWHGHIDPKTVAWWMKNSAEAKAASFGGTQEAVAIAVQLRRALSTYQINEVWANDPTFDLVILKHWWGRIANPAPAGPWPVSYRAERSFRTICAEAKRLQIDLSATKNFGVAHSAMDDAAGQARTVIAARQGITALFTGVHGYPPPSENQV